jgi:hypothetical protein
MTFVVIMMTVVINVNKYLYKIKIYFAMNLIFGGTNKNNLLII